MVAEKTNYELLAELVSSSRKVDEILNHYSHNFLMITRATFDDFRNLGLTPKEAIRIVSALEIFKRAYTQTNIRKISNSKDAYEIFKDLSFSRVEIFAVIFLIEQIMFSHIKRCSQEVFQKRPSIFVPS